MKNLLNVLEMLGYYEEGEYYVVSDLKENEDYIKENLERWDRIEYDKDIFSNEIIIFYIKK